MGLIDGQRKKEYDIPETWSAGKSGPVKGVFGMVKTNVMRLLDAARIVYETGTYEVDENDLSGSHAADLMGVDHDRMYKTLVLKGEKKDIWCAAFLWMRSWTLRRLPGQRGRRRWR